jgi:hypothetical protein
MIIKVATLIFTKHKFLLGFVNVEIGLIDFGDLFYAK